MENIQIPRIMFNNPEEVYEYFDEKNVEMLIDILNGINFGYKNKKKSVDVFEIKHIEFQTVLVFNLAEENWLGHLDNMMKRFVKFEEYELASKAKKLALKIKKREKNEKMSKSKK